MSKAIHDSLPADPEMRQQITHARQNAHQRGRDQSDRVHRRAPPELSGGASAALEAIEEAFPGFPAVGQVVFFQPAQREHRLQDAPHFIPDVAAG
jgi:hypothetical protein